MVIDAVAAGYLSDTQTADFATSVDGLVRDSDHTPSSSFRHSSFEFVASNILNSLQYTC